MRRINTLFIIFFLFFNGLSAQNDRNAINSALKSYGKGDYAEAASILDGLYSENAPEEDPFGSTELFLLTRIDYETGRDEKVLRRSVTFMDYFEFSRYTEHILYLKANSLLRLFDYEAALVACIQALDHSTSDLENNIKALARDISRYYLDENDIIAAASFHTRREYLVFSEMLLAENMIKKAQRREAGKKLQQIRKLVRKRYDSIYYNELVKEYRAMKKEKPALNIGVVLPLSGDNAEAGNAILQGLKFAVEYYKEFSTMHVDLVVRDNRGELIESVNAARYLAEMPDIAAVIGPLSSRNAVAMAGTCEMYGLPLLNPTATISDLQELGRTVFQFNTNHRDRAKAFAEFAIDSLGLRTFATISPSDDYGINSAEGFIEAVENKGGEVVYMGWYSGDPNDLKIQYADMRRIAFDILESDTLDTTNVLLDSTLVLKTAGDSLKIKLSTIDGLYLPIYQEHIKFVLPQFAWWNFDLQILGDGGFYDFETLENYRSYVNGAVFTNNYYINEDDEEFLELSAVYRQKSGGNDLEMLNIYGFEMISFLLNALRSGSYDRETLLDKLNEVQAYRGLIRNFHFDARDSRANQGIRIISYRDRKLHVMN